MKHNTVPQIGHPIHFLALGFGSGLAPVAPGTFGTLAAIPLFLLLAQLPLSAYLLTLALICLAGIFICGKTARDWGVHDHSAIVWDEFAGFLLTMTAAPRHWLWIMLGFGLFRLFDIWKPFPIGLLDAEVDGGLGIMLDDLVAGLYALLCLQTILYLS
ncbi:MAG TPA: phosphatidylglycerophosphatase A [Pseudomonadales bacterium]|nr:phosphatidylglycerophosphatase A [Pseudomonadales bacterium]